MATTRGPNRMTLVNLTTVAKEADALLTGAEAA